jgi:hypothetical protein
MNKILLLFFFGCAGMPFSQAQLLKKLKEKANKVLEPSKPADNNNNQTSGNSEHNGNTNNRSAVSKAEDEKFDYTQCQLVFTMDGASGEKLMYDETTVFANNNKLSYAFVTTNKKYEYFLIEDGKRTGPFNEPKLPSMKRNDDDDEGGGNSRDDGKIDIGGSKKDPVAVQYTKTIGGKLHIVFNGKNHGPFDYVAKMLVSPDKKKFFAVVTIGGASSMTAQMGMGNTYIINESGIKQKFGDNGSFPYQMQVSNGFKHAMVTVMDNSAQKTILGTTTGKKTEGTVADIYGRGGFAKVNDAGDIVSVPSNSPTQVLVNGNEAAVFKVPVTNASRLFLLPDISKSVYYEKGKLYRGDGSQEDVKHITFPRVVTLNGETAIYYYKMKKNEKGDTEVYLCKKVL